MELVVRAVGRHSGNPTWAARRSDGRALGAALYGCATPHATVAKEVRQRIAGRVRSAPRARLTRRA